MSRPSFTFYPDNWLNDISLRACSAASRGIWMDLMCIMHSGTPYGHLSGPNGAFDDRYVARRCTVSTKELTRAVNELASHGVFSRTELGVLFSRRMVRDEKIRISRAEGGHMSAKNKNVPSKKDVIKDTHKGRSEGEDVEGSSTLVLGLEKDSVLVVSSEKKNKEEPLEQFNGLRKLYDALGKPTNERDWMDAAREWVSLEPVECQEACVYASVMASGEWKDPKYIPLPARFISGKPWTRKAPPAIIKPPDQGMKAALLMRKNRQQMQEKRQ